MQFGIIVSFTILSLWWSPNVGAGMAGKASTVTITLEKIGTKEIIHITKPSNMEFDLFLEELRDDYESIVVRRKPKHQEGGVSNMLPRRLQLHQVIEEALIGTDANPIQIGRIRTDPKVTFTLINPVTKEVTHVTRRAGTLWVNFEAMLMANYSVVNFSPSPTTLCSVHADLNCLKEYGIGTDKNPIIIGVKKGPDYVDNKTVIDYMRKTYPDKFKAAMEGAPPEKAIFAVRLPDYKLIYVKRPANMKWVDFMKDLEKKYDGSICDMEYLPQELQPKRYPWPLPLSEVTSRFNLGKASNPIRICGKK